MPSLGTPPPLAVPTLTILFLDDIKPYMIRSISGCKLLTHFNDVNFIDAHNQSGLASRMNGWRAPVF